jgi:hypothetical protein
MRNPSSLLVLGNRHSINALRTLLDYERETGVFRWKVNRSRTRAGDIAGSVSRAPRDQGGGYRNIGVEGRRYYAHVLAIAFETGRWPAAQVDHRDLDRDNNRFENLRAATRAQNNANRAVRSNSKSGVKGASFRTDRGWRSRIRVDGKEIFLGYFETASEAHSAYRTAAQRYFGEFAKSA